MEQALRLRNEAFSRNADRGVYTSDARMNRIDDIADKYLNNIAGTRSFRRTTQAAMRALASRNEREEDRGYAMRDAAFERKYSRRTYMGLSKG